MSGNHTKVTISKIASPSPMTEPFQNPPLSKPYPTRAQPAYYSHPKQLHHSSSSSSTPYAALSAADRGAFEISAAQDKKRYEEEQRVFMHEECGVWDARMRRIVSDAGKPVMSVKAVSDQIRVVPRPVQAVAVRAMVAACEVFFATIAREAFVMAGSPLDGRPVNSGDLAGVFEGDELRFGFLREDFPVLTDEQRAAMPAEVLDEKEGEKMDRIRKSQMRKSLLITSRDLLNGPLSLDPPHKSSIPMSFLSNFTGVVDGTPSVAMAAPPPVVVVSPPPAVMAAPPSAVVAALSPAVTALAPLVVTALAPLVVTAPAPLVVTAPAPLVVTAPAALVVAAPAPLVLTASTSPVSAAGTDEADEVDDADDADEADVTMEEDDASMVPSKTTRKRAPNNTSDAHKMVNRPRLVYSTIASLYKARKPRGPGLASDPERLVFAAEYREIRARFEEAMEKWEKNYPDEFAVLLEKRRKANERHQKIVTEKRKSQNGGGGSGGGGSNGGDGSGGVGASSDEDNAMVAPSVRQGRSSKAVRPPPTEMIELKKPVKTPRVEVVEPAKAVESSKAIQAAKIYEPLKAAVSDIARPAKSLRMEVVQPSKNPASKDANLNVTVPTVVAPKKKVPAPKVWRAKSDSVPQVAKIAVVVSPAVVATAAATGSQRELELSQSAAFYNLASLTEHLQRRKDNSIAAESITKPQPPQPVSISPISVAKVNSKVDVPVVILEKRTRGKKVVADIEPVLARTMSKAKPAAPAAPLIPLLPVLPVVVLAPQVPGGTQMRYVTDASLQAPWRKVLMITPGKQPEQLYFNPVTNEKTPVRPQ